MFRARSRRHFIGSGLGLAALTAHPLTRAAALRPTPRQSRGPFYPSELPLDRDNDLVRVVGQPEAALGEYSHVVGKVLDRDGRTVPNAVVEIWQCDAKGRYHHPGDRRDIVADPGFQGYGRFETASDGAYRFRTIRPVAYPGRAPHIHFAVAARGRPGLVTQMYVEGAPENPHDFLLRHAGGLDSPLVVPFETSPDDAARYLARFDIVLG